LDHAHAKKAYVSITGLAFIFTSRRDLAPLEGEKKIKRKGKNELTLDGWKKT